MGTKSVVSKLPQLEPNLSLKRIEEATRELWDSTNVRRMINEARRNSPVIGFIEGPPTMNGEPHIGHIRGRVIKDLWFRLETMKGNRVVFRAGWDTQGLPVELQAERELGLRGSKSEVLKKITMEKLVEKCKEIVHKYNKIWLESDRLLGILLDYESAYWTYRDEYIEREWRYLKEGWEKKVLGEGYRVVAYCPSCQTSLSHSEVASSYEELEDPSVYYKTKLEGQEDTYLLIWTTMPYTVVTDELIAVNPDSTYVYIRLGGETWVLAEERLSELVRELGIKGEVVKKVKGVDLEGLRYTPPLLNEVPGQQELFKHKKAHLVVAEKFVDTTTGTGLVHLSPANGEEDFEVARKRGIPIFNPIDDQARFTSDAGRYSGLYVRDADELVIKDLERKGLLVKATKIVHEYPVCWRSGHRLVFVARREYFYWVDRIINKALEAAESIEYYYPQPRNRFIEIIREARPWCVSRERVWGTPLPIWVCGRCGDKIFVSSRSEILKRAIKLPNGPDFELHRPWVDRVVLRCDRCGGEAYREPFVLDTWHNSGAAPYASMDDSEFNQLVPVPFLTEGIDQTRGWAYSLLIEHVILADKGEAPYKAFLFLGHVLDEKGEKMSKSKGNVIYALDIFKSYPVDLVRYYLMWKASPIDPINFSIREMRERPYQVLNTLVNLLVFLKQNSEYDGFKWAGEDPERLIKNPNLKVQDRWMLSLTQRLVKNVLEAYEKRRLHDAARELERFIIEVVSQRYVPLIRGELWDDSPRTLPRRLVIYDVLSHVLLVVLKLLHPIAPYTTDYLYNSFYVDQPSSLVITDLPSYDPRFVDKGLEEEFELAWDLVSLANSARMKSKLKRRWSLAMAYVYAGRRLRGDLRSLLKHLINVHGLKLVEDPEELPAELVVKPVKSRLGKRYKSETPILLNRLSSINAWELAERLSSDGLVRLSVDDKEFVVEPEDLEFVVEPREGYSASYRDGRAVVLYVVRDERLTLEGVVRDVARRIQALRKERGYKPTEILDSAYLYSESDVVRRAVETFREELLHLVRVKELKVLGSLEARHNWKEYEIDDSKVYIDV